MEDPRAQCAPNSEYGSHYLNHKYLITCKKDNIMLSRLLNPNERKMVGEHDGRLQTSKELRKME